MDILLWFAIGFLSLLAVSTVLVVVFSIKNKSYLRYSEQLHAFYKKHVGVDLSLKLEKEKMDRRV